MRFLKVYVWKERLDIGRYCKLGGVSGHAPPENFSNLGAQKCYVLHFSQDVFSK